MLGRCSCSQADRRGAAYIVVVGTSRGTLPVQQHNICTYLTLYPLAYALPMTGREITNEKGKCQDLTHQSRPVVKIEHRWNNDLAKRGGVSEELLSSEYCVRIATPARNYHGLCEKKKKK